MNEQRYCKNCGNTLNPDWQFCEHCGNQVSQNAPREAGPTVMPPPGPPPSAQTTPQPMEQKRSLLWLLPVGIGCIGLICICVFTVAGYFYFSDPDFMATSPTLTQISEVRPSATATPVPSSTNLPTMTDSIEPTDPPTSTEAPPTLTEPAPTDEGNGLTGNQYKDEFSIFDDFSSKALGWPEYDDGITILQYENETYSLQITEPDYVDWAYAPVEFWPNQIQFDVWGLPGSQDGTFGVFCQFQDFDNYYFVEVDLETREFAMGQYLDGEFIPLTSSGEDEQYWLSADSLKSNPEDVNHIYLSCPQEFMVLSINDSLVYQATLSDPFPSPGEMAFFVYTYSFAGPDGYKVFFDNVGVQNMIQ